jgi:hypothetical protein
LKLASNYNALCAQLAKLIERRKAPRNAIAPQPIQSNGLFNLDVDDEIWQDVGLDDDSDGPMPLWLCNDDVRRGIKSLLEVDRCIEEEQRLRMERCALQEWLFEEWSCIERAKDLAGEKIHVLHDSCRLIGDM